MDSPEKQWQVTNKRNREWEGSEVGREIAFKFGFSYILETVSGVECRNQGGIPCVFLAIVVQPNPRTVFLKINPFSTSTLGAPSNRLDTTISRLYNSQ